eukprot:7739491-Pyramimonas_sp.AAC.1
MLQHDGSGAEILMEIERLSASKQQEWHRDTDEVDPSLAWDALVTDLRAAALPELQQTNQQGSLSRDYRERRRELLELRRQLRLNPQVQQLLGQLGTLLADTRLRHPSRLAPDTSRLPVQFLGPPAPRRV